MQNYKKTLADLTGVQRAAIYIMNLDKEDAASVLKYLGPKQVQKLGVAMASLENIDKPHLNAVMQDFIECAEQQTSLGVSNDDYIREVLTDALGEDKALGVLDRILKGGNTKGLETLKWMEPRTVADIIRVEHPQIQSIVLSYLDSDQAAEVLGFFKQRERLDLMLRIATLETVQPMAIQELNDILEKQFHGKTEGAIKAVGGLKSAAGIMNYLDTGAEAELMNEIKERNPELGQNIQDLMFVFDNLIDVEDRGIQALLREISSDLLILALKGADIAVKEKIYSNMSKRAVELLKDDLEAKGPVRVTEVEKAQKEILTVARRMSEAGELLLGGRGQEEMI